MLKWNINVAKFILGPKIAQKLSHSALSCADTSWSPLLDPSVAWWAPVVPQRKVICSSTMVILKTLRPRDKFPILTIMPSGGLSGLVSGPYNTVMDQWGLSAVWADGSISITETSLPSSFLLWGPFQDNRAGGLHHSREVSAGDFGKRFIPNHQEKEGDVHQPLLGCVSLLASLAVSSQCPSS